MNFIKLKLKQGNYTEVEKACAGLQMVKIRDVMMEIAYETESISVYGFIQHMIQKLGKEDWIRLAIDILINPLCCMEGAYSLALFHARELLKMKKSIENLERILFFYNIPEKLIDESEALCIAKEILGMEPNNKIALEVKISITKD